MIGVHDFTESMSLLPINWRHGIIVLALGYNLFVVRKSHCPQLKTRSRLYGDRNGQASLTTTRGFNQRSRRLSIFISAALGLSASVVSVVLGALHYSHPRFDQAIVTFASWILVAAQCALLFIETCSCHPHGWRVGLFIAISSGFLGLDILLKWMQTGGQSRRLFVIEPGSISIVVQILLSLSLCLNCLDLPRRPAVYFDNELVDEQSYVSILNTLAFGWTGRLFDHIQATSQVQFHDLPHLDFQTRASQLHRKFAPLARNRNRPLWRMIYQSLQRRILWGWCLAALHGLALYGPQYCLYKTLKLLEQSQTSGVGDRSLWLWAAGIGMSRLLEYMILTRLEWFAASAVEIPVRTQLSAIVYQKALSAKDVKLVEKPQTEVNADKDRDGELDELKKGGIHDESDLASLLSEDDVGEAVPLQNMQGQLEAGKCSAGGGQPEELTQQGVMNLIAVDAPRVAEFVSKQYVFVHIFVTFTVAVVTLARLIGVLSLCVGLLAPVVLMPLNMAASSRYAAAQADLMEKRDDKMRVVSEALQAIRQIKFSATEPQWFERIMGPRAEEFRHQRSVFRWTVALRLFWVSSPILLSVLALGAYVWTHGPLTAAVAFTAIEVFGNLEFALSLLPYGIMQALSARVSCDRVQEYLDREDKSRATVDGAAIEFRDATVAWPSTSQDGVGRSKFQLSHVSCKFSSGGLNIIIGPSGSGKSLLLATIIDEADVLSGKVSVPRPALNSFPQNMGPGRAEDWIVPGTLACVTQTPWLESCSLRDNVLFGLPMDQKRYDLAIDGANLKPDLALLVDGDHTEVGFRGVNFSGGQCWRIALARALYSRADILVLDDIFSAVDTGTALHILDHGLDGPLAQGRTRILATHHHALCLPRASYTLRIHADGKVQGNSECSPGSTVEFPVHKPTIDDLDHPVHSSTRADHSLMTNKNIDRAQPVVQRQALVEEEFRATGAVKASVYRKYMLASGGYVFWLISSIFIVGSQVAILGRAYWVKVWTESDNAGSPDSSKRRDAFYMCIYLVVSLAAALGEAVKCGVVYHAGVKASLGLSRSMTAAILGAPLRWLDVTPVGRILNRASADSATVDSKLPGDAHMLLSSIVLVAITALTSLGVSLFLLVPGAALLTVTLMYGYRFLRGAREIKRLESASRSPILDLFESTLLGLGTIRAYARADEFVVRMMHHLDNQSRSTWSLCLVTQWMDFRMSAIGAVFSLMVAVFVVVKNVDPSLAGLVLSFSFRYTAATEEVINRYANVELNMNATERIVELSEVAQESLEGLDAPHDWPQHGAVSIRDLVVSYERGLDEVLKGLSVHVSPNQRVGIVGRTGAGKSSFALAMLRFLHQRSGSITIDGIDISQIRLRDLRSRVTLIPQDPTLFSGSLRSNLDPLGRYDDETLCTALRRVRLIGHPDDQTRMFESLDLEISQGGLSLSHGQRQLVCLARALLARSKVMVIDEATSSVDVAMDALIQKSIRDEFHDSTLFVIAHRLRTVADFDQIVVLDDGRLCESGTPRELYESRGTFWAMVQDSGEADSLQMLFKE